MEEENKISTGTTEGTVIFGREVTEEEQMVAMVTQIMEKIISQRKRERSMKPI
jgi:hypothetical protein